MKLNLTKFAGARVEEIETDKGMTERGVFIPIEDNDLYVSHRTGNVYANGFVTENYDVFDHRKTHYITLKLSKRLLRRFEREGRKSPVLGNLMESSYMADKQHHNFGEHNVKADQE